MVFIVLLGLWALVLGPTALRWFRDRSNKSSWESIGEQAVSQAGDRRNHLAIVNGAQAPGNYFGDAPIGEHRLTDPSADARREMCMRRRSVLLSLAGAFIGLLVFSLVPSLRFLRMVALLDLFGLLAFVGFAFYATNAEAFAELLGRGEAEESYGYEQDDAYAYEAYDGYDEADGYEDQWYEPRRAIGQ